MWEATKSMCLSWVLWCCVHFWVAAPKTCFCLPPNRKTPSRSRFWSLKGNWSSRWYPPCGKVGGSMLSFWGAVPFVGLGLIGCGLCHRFTRHGTESDLFWLGGQSWGRFLRASLQSGEVALVLGAYSLASGSQMVIKQFQSHCACTATSDSGEQSRGIPHRSIPLPPSVCRPDWSVSWRVPSTWWFQGGSDHKSHRSPEPLKSPTHVRRRLAFPSLGIYHISH